MKVPSNALAPVDTSWFDANPEAYLERDDFQEFQKISSVDLRDLFAEDVSILQKAQEKIVSQSKIFNEIRNEHSGYGPPFLYYTHNFCFGEELSNHNVELDKLVLAMNQGDSLRRRRLALSHAILPNVIQEIARENGRAIRLKNLGSGVGLDVINAVRNTDGCVKTAWQYDTNQTAVKMGKTITDLLEKENEIPKSVINYTPESFLSFGKNVDLLILVGVICGLNNRAAFTTLRLAYRMLRGGANCGFLFK